MLPDPNKYGWEASKLWSELTELNQYQYLKIQGLMTILPYGLSKSKTLSAFQKTSKISNNNKTKELLKLEYETAINGNE